MAFFTRRYEALELEVSLLERRVASGALSPDDAAGSVKTVRNAVDGAHAVGDLDALLARLDALAPRLAEQRAAAGPRRPRRTRRPGRPRRPSSSRPRSWPPATTGAAGSTGSAPCWTSGRRCPGWTGPPTTRCGTASPARAPPTPGAARPSSRSRTSSASRPAASRSSWRSRPRRSPSSTDWGPTTGAYRDLMQRWKDAGPAPRGVDEALWRRFRAAQDTFFAAKPTAMSEQDAEFRANAEAKETAARRGRGAAAGHRPGRRPRLYRDLHRALVGAGQGPARLDPPAGEPAARDRVGGQRRRGGALAADQPRGPRPRRGHRRQARGPDRAAAGTKAEKAEARGDTKAAPEARNSGADLPASGWSRPARRSTTTRA